MKTNLGSMLSFMPSASDKQLNCILSWMTDKVCSGAFISTNQTIPNVFGLNAVPYRQPEPTLRHAIVSHLSKIRGREVIGFANPDVIINPDFSKIHAITSGGGLGMDISWGFFVPSKDKDRPAPVFFALTTPLLPHIVRDLKDDVRFVDDEWAVWLHEWCKRTMLPHKYVDISDKISVTRIKPVVPAKKKKKE